MKSLLIFDMSFTLKVIKDLQLEQTLESRKLDGYFSNVISVHPLSGLSESGDNYFGKPTVTWLDDSHVFIEGKIAKYRLLRLIPKINFLFAQINLMWLLFKITKKNKVDVVRIGDPYYLGLMGWIFSRILRSPLVIRVCSNYDDLYKTAGEVIYPKLFRFRCIEKIIEQFIFPRCKLVAGANQNNLEYAISNGANPKYTAVFRYGNLISPIHFVEPCNRASATHLLSKLGVYGDFIATVSRLEKMKQAEQNIFVIKHLVEAGYNVKFIFIGDGSMRLDLEEMTDEFHLSRNIFFAGNCTQEWIARVLPAARIILSPHMGRGLTEACLAGVPIVAYDNDWQREIITNGQTGELVPDGDWMRMSLRAKYLLDNQDIAIKLGRNARDSAMNMMSPETLTKIEVASYGKLLNEDKI